MITVTNEAKQGLYNILQARELASGKILRLAMAPDWTGEGDFGVVIGDKRDQDHVVIFKDTDVIAVGVELVGKLSSGVLDFKKSSGGDRFTLDVY